MAINIWNVLNDMRVDGEQVGGLSVEQTAMLRERGAADANSRMPSQARTLRTISEQLAYRDGYDNVAMPEEARTALMSEGELRIAQSNHRRYSNKTYGAPDSDR